MLQQHCGGNSRAFCVHEVFSSLETTYITVINKCNGGLRSAVTETIVGVASAYHAGSDLRHRLHVVLLSAAGQFSGDLLAILKWCKSPAR